MYENQCSTSRIISDPQVHNVWLDPDPTFNLENVKKHIYFHIYCFVFLLGSHYSKLELHKHLS